MKTIRYVGFWIGWTALFATLASAAEPGLVAHWDFNEGSGTTLKDVSGNGNDGTIHGAQYVKRGRGYCLEFDGVKDFVDCGSKPALDLHDAITLEAWVHPDARVTGEPGFLGKHFESYLLTLYMDGKCYWYITTGGNNAKNLLTVGSWHHVAGTFDGKTVKLFVDGKLVDANPSQFPKIKPGKNFFIGCVVGDPNATDPNYVKTTYFPGQIDEVRVYDRALTDEEVRAHFETDAKQLDLATPYEPAPVVASIRNRLARVSASKAGQVQVETAGRTYLIESAYSFPGERIGWNAFAGGPTGCEPTWKPRVEKSFGSRLRIRAEGNSCRVVRTVTLTPTRIEFEDKLMNLLAEPLGLIVRHDLTAPKPFREAFTPGSGENPTIFLDDEHGCVGLLAEDDISRIRFEPRMGVPANRAGFRAGNFAVGVGKTVTLRWAMYLLDKGANYFDLVNRVRRDWKNTFTIEGPFSFFDLGTHAGLLENPDKLKAYLQRRKLRIAAMSPWLDYDPGSFDHTWSRAEYKERIQKAVRAIKAADPEVKCIGSIETDWVAIYPDKIPNGNQLPAYNTGHGMLNSNQTAIIEKANLPWKDSVKRRDDGNLTLELYSRGGKPQWSLSVYPAIGNYQYEFLMGQVKFLLDECGLDGFYIDEFSQGWGGGIPSYGGWDGISVELDPRTGKIRRKYIDCSLAGVKARVNLVRYALDRGKLVVANTYATAMEENALAVNRFSETWGSFNPFAVPDGVKPAVFVDIFRGNLTTPIGLGIKGAPRPEDSARWLYKAVVTYLRHGALYYHYAIGDLPETGPGSGEYGPINHMFPITPTGIHEGWIEGKERMVTCVSGTFFRKKNEKQLPKIHRYNLEGRELPHGALIICDKAGWRIELKLKDWAEIAVIE